MPLMTDFELCAAEGTGREFTVSLNVWLQGAEPDVGIMSSYVDDWEITGFNGRYDKRTISRINKFIDSRPKLREAVEEHISEMEFD